MPSTMEVRSFGQQEHGRARHGMGCEGSLPKHSSAPAIAMAEGPSTGLALIDTWRRAAYWPGIILPSLRAKAAEPLSQQLRELERLQSADGAAVIH